MSNLILTEEELSRIEKSDGFFTTESIVRLINSHRELFKSNAELSFEIMMRKRYEGFLKVVARSGEELEDHQDFEWFKVRTAIFSKKEELK